MEGMSHMCFHYSTYKKKGQPVSFLHSSLSLTLLLPFENMNALEWFLYFQRVKVLKSTSLFQGGGKKSKSDYLKCSLGKGKNEQAMWWQVVTAPTFLSIALWSPWLENKTQCIGLHSKICGACGTNSSPNYYDDELVPVEKFYSGQYCNVGNTCFHALPPPILTSSHPRWTPALLVRSFSLVCGLSFLSEIHRLVFNAWLLLPPSPPRY